MKRQRKSDRRQYGSARRFPITDQFGCVIPFNRSRLPDRRLRSYRLAEVDAEEFVIKEVQARQRSC